MKAEGKKRLSDEMTIRLKAEGFGVAAQEDDCIQVTWNGQRICLVVPTAGGEHIEIYLDDIRPELEQTQRRATTVVKRVSDYMVLASQAPQIKASGLEGDYRSLAEFNNIVLAGHQTKYGMEFVTWEWVQDHTALWQGHYMGSYEAAKQDFTVRAGLVPQSRLFGDQQLAEIYRCIHETLESEYPITVEREKELKGIADQIEDAVPTLEALVYQSNLLEMEGGDVPESPGMTQQF